MGGRLRWFLSHVLRRGAAERELEDEIGAHLRFDAERRIEAGQSPKDAWNDAHRQFGNVGVVKDVTRDLWGGRWIDELATDVRASIRALARTPRFAFVGVVTLGVAITTTGVALSTVDRALWRPLPFPGETPRRTENGDARGSQETRFRSPSTIVVKRLKRHGLLAMLAWRLVANDAGAP